MADTARVIWDSARAQRWLAQLEQREAALAPVADALFEVAGLTPGERVLDVGCGAGSTTVRAAELVGPTGRAVGADISIDMLDAARKRSAAPNVAWVCADLGQHAFEPASFDVIMSRFGVMFFADPLRAFRELCRACRPGGRLVVAVWPPRDQVPYFDLPYRAVGAALDRRGVDHPDLGPLDTMFSLGDRARTTELLNAAGWSGVTWTHRADRNYVGGPGSVAAAAPALMRTGPVQALIEAVPPTIVSEVEKDLVEALRPYFDGTGVRLASEFVILTASR